MTAKEGKQWWDPYETSNKRQFIYRPTSAVETVRCWSPTSTSFIDTFSQAGPLGSTVYNKDFCWKPVCKPECIRSGTASGQRRNNPHPTQSFMIWRLPREATQSSNYVGLPWRRPPSEGAIHEALIAQYSSTYRRDFLGMPQGYDHRNNDGGRLAALHSRCKVLFSTDTEMRANYRKPAQKSELLGHSYHTDPACHGIVPTVVQRHVHSQQRGYDLTTYNRFYGKRVADVEGVLKSLLPHELQQLKSILPEEEKEAGKTTSNKDTRGNNKEKVNKLPTLCIIPAQQG